MDDQTLPPGAAEGAMVASALVRTPCYPAP